ncbi:MAG: hypothetical protein HY210_07785 [Candidatus Omnitrophica bacterium]|nr:hypothetical protein [Candidatus Omnitrophota bacterium]
MREKGVGTMPLAIVGIIVVASPGAMMLVADGAAETACTQEAKLCSDGSYVGRVSANCEFAPCPGEELPPGSAPEGSGLEQELTAGGIAGEVVLGPRCPVIGPGMEEKCADKGYPTTLVVKTKDGEREVARVRSGVDGRFRAALAPGEYIVAPLPGARPLPYCKMQFVTVEPGQFAPVTIHCDTGIR